MFDYSPPKLSVSKLHLDDPAAIALATIIAEETECQRELERQKFPDSPPRPGHGNLGRGLLGDGSYSYADNLHWDVLLTFGDCVFRCSNRAKTTASAVLEFAMDKCKPSQVWTLFWFQQLIDRVTEDVKTSAQRQVADAVGAKALALQQKVRDGASRGGRRSAETRRQNSRVPDDAALLDARQKLLDSGRAAREVAAILATRWKVTPDMVRRRLSAALKRN